MPESMVEFERVVFNQDYCRHPGGTGRADHGGGATLPGSAIEVKRRIGYVPENAVLFESLSGQEFLELSGRLQDVEETRLQSRIASILETFGLSWDRVSRLDSYSKGMRQKILIAAALLHNPELILLDEPLSGLDVNAAIMIKDLLAALAADDPLRAMDRPHNRGSQGWRWRSRRTIPSASRPPPSSRPAPGSGTLSTVRPFT